MVSDKALVGGMADAPFEVKYTAVIPSSHFSNSVGKLCISLVVLWLLPSFEYLGTKQSRSWSAVTDVTCAVDSSVKTAAWCTSISVPNWAHLWALPGIVSARHQLQNAWGASKQPPVPPSGYPLWFDNCICNQIWKNSHLPVPPSGYPLWFDNCICNQIWKNSHLPVYQDKVQVIVVRTLSETYLFIAFVHVDNEHW